MFYISICQQPSTSAGNSVASTPTSSFDTSKYICREHTPPKVPLMRSPGRLKRFRSFLTHFLPLWALTSSFVCFLFFSLFDVFPWKLGARFPRGTDDFSLVSLHETMSPPQGTGTAEHRYKLFYRQVKLCALVWKLKDLKIGDTQYLILISTFPTIFIISLPREVSIIVHPRKLRHVHNSIF